jgi:hypothetical protein
MLEEVTRTTGRPTGWRLLRKSRREDQRNRKEK